MRLLPKDREIGWMPFAWLVYLGIFLVEPIMRRLPPREWLIIAAALVVFLVLYFRGFWVKGRRLIPLGAGIALLGSVMMPLYSGASVFFVYAAVFFGLVPPPRVAWRLIGGLIVLIGLVTWVADVTPFGWVPAAVFSLLIGAVNIRQAATSRRNARLRLEQEEVEGLARSAERERIARDLHDLLGQSLSLITLKSELAAKLAASDPDRAAQEMRDVEATSREALREVRRAVSGYRSLGLSPELSRARLTLEAAGVELEIESGPYHLEPDAEGVAALALREAVTNVVRHARAARCRVAFRQEGSRFHLEIADDGRGYRGAAGSGLTGMRERIEALGGSLDLVDLAGQAEGRGTRVEVLLPTQGGPARREEPAIEAAS